MKQHENDENPFVSFGILVMIDRLDGKRTPAGSPQEKNSNIGHLIDVHEKAAPGHHHDPQASNLFAPLRVAVLLRQFPTPAAPVGRYDGFHGF